MPPGRFGETALDLERVLAEGFGEQCLAFASVWMHSRSSTSESSNMQDYEASGLDIRTCAASGTKFFDRNAGVRDSDDPGIPASSSGRTTTTTAYAMPASLSPSRTTGRYVIYDIRPPDGTYTLREKLATRRSRTPPVGTGWVCSYPNEATPGGTGSAPNGRFGCGWGPIDERHTVRARAQLRQLVPGRAHGQEAARAGLGPRSLQPAGEVVLPAAGDDARVTLSVPPGVYDISEIAVEGPTPPPIARVSIADARPTAGAGGEAIEFEDLALFAGQRVKMFRNAGSARRQSHYARWARPAPSRGTSFATRSTSRTSGTCLSRSPT